MPKLNLTPEQFDRLANAPMAMRPEALRSLMARIVSVDVWEEPPALEASIVEQAPVAEEAKVPRLAKVKGSIAVLPVFGTIAQHRGSDYWGGVFTEELVGRTAQLIDSPNIGAVVMSFDTPGGIVYGVGEAAEAIRELGQQKPIYGHVKAMSASAGYWLAASCVKLFAQPSAEVGSIGVWTMHADVSAALEKFGVNISLISAGKHKVDGNMFGPLSDDARDDIQAGVDRYYGEFLDGVAIGRNVSKTTAKNDFGEGRMFGVDKAKSAGMIDGVCSLGELLVGVMEPVDSRRRNQSARIALASAWNPDGDA